jgi:UrcA family protein
MFVKALVPAFAVLALATQAAPVLAQSFNDPAQVSVRVKLADLNLQSADGARTALHRIQAAAATICGPEPTAREIMVAGRHPCAPDIVAAAVAKLGNSRVWEVSTGPTRPATR